MPLSYKDVADLLKIIDTSSCEEVILEVEGLRLVVRRGASGDAGNASQSAPPSSSPATTWQARPGIKAASRSSKLSTTAAAEAGLLQVRAPMVGTFYRRPSPKDQPFAEAGQRVAQGDPLGLIEVMKLYTTISAPASGVIEQIVADDGTLVEFDDLLLVIRAD